MKRNRTALLIVMVYFPLVILFITSVVSNFDFFQKSIINTDSHIIDERYAGITRSTPAKIADGDFENGDLNLAWNFYNASALGGARIHTGQYGADEALNSQP